MKYRNIVEMSVMINNDERIFYTNEQLDNDVVIRRCNPFDDPKLIISRPVYPEEVEAGLNTNWSGSTFDENRPEITSALDDFYKLKRQIDLYLKAGMDLEFVLNQAVAYNFYDCMSGGCGAYFLSACRWFLENSDIDLEKEVYPASSRYPGSGENGWHTFRDFLREIERVPRIEDMMAQFPNTRKLLSSGE